LLGQPLRGARFLRMAVALMAAGLLPPHAVDLAPRSASPAPKRAGSPPTADRRRAVRPGTTARADQPRRVPRDRSRNRPGRGTAR
jgi:hypothetical protein